MNRSAVLFLLVLLGLFAWPLRCPAPLVYTPGEGMQWPVLAGVVITLAIGEFVIRSAENHRRR